MFRASAGSIGSMLYKTERRPSFPRSKRSSVTQIPMINSEKLREIRIELDHAKMQLTVEEDRVNELEKNLNTLIDEKYRSDSALIARLRESLDHLRLELALSIESKQQLASATAGEMVKLRDVIRILTDQIYELTHQEATIRTFGDIQTLQDARVKSQSHQKNKHSNKNNSVNNKNSSNNNSTNKEDEEKAITDDAFDHITPGNNNNNKLDMTTDTSKDGDDASKKKKTNKKNKNQKFRPKHIENHPFPYINNRAIHFITLKLGDGKTYPQAYSTVHLLYTGYIYEPPAGQSTTVTDREDIVPSNWRRFTDISTTCTVSATPLGVGQNIPGIEHAVMRMSVGQKARVYVPSRLAYGSHGAKELIPANADLIFDLHLVAAQNSANMNDDLGSHNPSMIPESGNNSENDHDHDHTSGNANGKNKSANNGAGNNRAYVASEEFITQEIHEQSKGPLENLLAAGKDPYHSSYDGDREPTEDL